MLSKYEGKCIGYQNKQMLNFGITCFPIPKTKPQTKAKLFFFFWPAYTSLKEQITEVSKSMKAISL